MNSNTKIHSLEPESTYSINQKKLFPQIYQAVWRWHFYAGIIFAPFIMILAFSGSMYLFKPQIEGMMYKEMLTVSEIGNERLTSDEIMNKMNRDYPNMHITSIAFSEDKHATVKLSVIQDQISKTLYIDPYTGYLKGILNNDKTFSSIFKKIHSQLFFGGTWANRLVELAACWGLILVISGLYLWWPRGKSKIWGTLLPRWQKPGSRQFWRDLHAVPAFWLSLGIIVVIATGLPWSGVLGGQIDRAANATNTNYPPYALSFMAKPESVTVMKEVADDIPWAAENLPVPESSVGDYLVLSVQDVMNIAEKQHVELPYTISLPRDETGVYTISTAHTRPGNDATLHLDQYSGAVLTDVRFQDYGIMAKLITLGIAFHEGRLFGLANQILGLIICLGMITVSISSYIMWRKRKPSSKLGAPGRPKDKRIVIGLFIMMVLFGLVMPLVGASLIFVVLIDYLVLRRIPALKHWFST